MKVHTHAHTELNGSTATVTFLLTSHSNTGLARDQRQTYCYQRKGGDPACMKVAERSNKELTRSR
jgi:hypothetical protein